MSQSFATQWYRFGHLYYSKEAFYAYLAEMNRRDGLNLGRRRNFFNIRSTLEICPFPVGRQLAEQRPGITLPAWRQAQVHALRVTSWTATRYYSSSVGTSSNSCSTSQSEGQFELGSAGKVFQYRVDFKNLVFSGRSATS